MDKDLKSDEKRKEQWEQKMEEGEEGNGQEEGT